MKKYLKPSLLEIQVNSLYSLMDPSPTGGTGGGQPGQTPAPLRQGPNW